MTDAVTGTGSTVALVPGEDLYIRTKVSSSSFAGGVQQLVVRNRPTLDAAVSDTLTTKYFLVAINFDGDDAGFSEEDIEIVNCNLTKVSAMIFKVEPIQLGIVSVKIKANAVTEGNFASEELTVYYKPSQTSIYENEMSGSSLIIYPSPVKDYLEVSLTSERNETVKIAIMDMVGRVMTVTEFQSGSASIDCSGFANGIYIVRCTLAGQEIFRKFIKE
jgi:hypothetical protein